MKNEAELEKVYATTQRLCKTRKMDYIGIQLMNGTPMFYTSDIARKEVGDLVKVPKDTPWSEVLEHLNNSTLE